MDTTGPRVLLSLCLLTIALPPLAAAGPGAADGWLDREWGEQYDELDRQIRELRPWFQRVESTVWRRDALILESDRDPADIVLRRTTALLGHLQARLPEGALAAEAAELDALKRRGAMTGVQDAKARFELHQAVCKVRRAVALKNPLLGFDRILFVKKHRARMNHMCDQYFGFKAQPGGGLYVLLDAFGPGQKVRDLLAEAVCENGRFQGKKLTPGAFMGPDLSYDGREVLFAYTEAENTQYKWSERSTWHVFRIDAGGTHLRQLTDGAVNDFDPVWLPDGRVLFISERRGGFGRCHARPVPIFTLHAMDRDGADIRTVSLNESNEWHPSVDHNGMIVYTRWDYVDRGFNQAHHPWLTTPDGRDARIVHGNFKPNQGAAPLMEMDCRAVPGSNRYVGTAAAHHDQAYGSLLLIDPDVEDDDRMSPVRRLTPEVAFPEAERGGQQDYATAWPLDEDFHLCVYDAQATNRRGKAPDYGLYLVDAFGNKVLIYRDPAISCLSPIPLRPRPASPIISELARPTPPADWTSPAAVGKRDETPTTSSPGNPQPAWPAGRSAIRNAALRSSASLRGTSPQYVPVAVMNVYDGLLPWPEGTKITSLRVVQVLPKASPIHNEPFIGYGREKGARAVLGTVPVEPDGSAHFLAPANKMMYFQALDEHGLAVQSMRSLTYAHPGQPLTCQGCHNRRHRAPSATMAVPRALRRGPSEIAPDVDGTNPFSFPRLVQPILEKSCQPCHQKNAGKAPDLARGDWAKQKTRHFTSYINLQDYAFFYGAKGYGYDGWTPPRTIPGRFGARGSKLYAQLTTGSHKDRPKLSPQEMHRIAVWLDCNSDFFGSFNDVDAQCRGEVVQPRLE